MIDRSTTAPRFYRNPSNSVSPNFKFPPVSSPVEERAAEKSDQIGIKRPVPLKSPRLYEGLNVMERINPVTKVLSDSSINGTPRSSVEFYSMSNNSTETLASECATHDRVRQPLMSTHSRQMSLLNPNKLPKVLMMGYGHVTGSFTLDTSLVNQGPFEEVKRKGIIGDQGGGGVVREEKSKRDTGMFGFSGWGNISESLGGLLGGTELSSIKEAKVSSNAKSIPILSTPQSILFINLQLLPGESRSYKYRQSLPRGIPPSHRGRAIKVTYNLVVGTQRAAKIASQHNVRHVDIPFRVLPGVNGKVGSFNEQNLSNKLQVVATCWAMISCYHISYLIVMPAYHLYQRRRKKRPLCPAHFLLENAIVLRTISSRTWKRCWSDVAKAQVLGSSRQQRAVIDHQFPRQRIQPP